ncbi:MAG: hypothetical protein ACI8WT_004558 [Clostridium sp.]|jgi:hypothetical protein
MSLINLKMFNYMAAYIQINNLELGNRIKNINCIREAIDKNTL